MNQSEVLETLRAYVSQEILEGQDIGLDGCTPLLEWGIINSLEIARLVSVIHDRFGVEVPGDRIIIDNFKDLNSITNLLLDLAHVDQVEASKK